MLADFMAPEGSIYFDAIFGAHHGQAAVRAWLVPAMAEIEFIEFVPMAESVVFDDGEGESTLDEWQMVANMGEEKIPVSRGVSVRRHSAGWITWARDVYDTAAFRQPPPPEMEIEAAPLPDCPQVDWRVHEGATALALSERANDWAAGTGAPVEGSVADRPSGPLLFDGTTAVQEWIQGPLRGTSVRRFADGWLTYAADYFDTTAIV